MKRAILLALADTELQKIKEAALTTAAVFAIAIMITIPFNSSVVAQQRINTNTSQSTSNALPLKTIFKQVENSVVQITSKIPTAGIPNPQNPQSPNATH